MQAELGPPPEVDTVAVARAAELKQLTAELRGEVRDAAIELCRAAVRDANAARGELDAILSDPVRGPALLALLAEAQSVARLERALEQALAVTPPTVRSVDLRERAVMAERLAEARNTLARIAAASPVFMLLVPGLADTELSVEGLRAALDARVREVEASAESTVRDLEEGRLDPAKLGGAVRAALAARSQSGPRDPEVMEALTGEGGLALGLFTTAAGAVSAATGGTALLAYTAYSVGYGVTDSVLGAIEAARLRTAREVTVDPARALVSPEEVTRAYAGAALTAAFAALDVRAAGQALRGSLAHVAPAGAHAAAAAAAGDAATSAPIGALAARAAAELGDEAAERLFARLPAKVPAPIAALIEGGEARFVAHAVETWGAQAGRWLADVGPETVRNLRHALDAGDEAVVAFIARRAGGGAQSHIYGAIKDAPQGSLAALLRVMGDESLEHVATEYGPRGLRHILQVVPELSGLRAPVARALFPHVVSIGESAEAITGLLPATRAKMLADVEGRAVRALDEAAEAAQKGNPSAAAKAAKAQQVRQWADRMKATLPTLPHLTGPELSRRMAATIARAADPVAEGKAAAKLLAFDLAEGGHAVLRHGAHVTQQELDRRVIEGIAPDGLPSWSGVATRFESYAEMLAAREAAIAKAIEEARRTGQSVVEVTVDVGGGLAVAGRDCVAASARCASAVVAGRVPGSFVRVELNPDGTVKAVVQQFPNAGAAGITYTKLP